MSGQMRNRSTPVVSTLLVTVLAGCAVPEGDATHRTAAPAPAPRPTSVAEWVERSRDAVRASTRAFDLTELEGDVVVRTGRVISYPSDEQPLLDLTWLGDGEATRVRSTRQAVSVKHPDGSVSYSPWSEAGSVLLRDGGGKLLGAALDASSFAAYGANLTDDGQGSVRLETGLPSGGGWSATLSATTFLPRSVSFQAAADGEIERLILEPVADFDPPPPPDLPLEPAADLPARRFYVGPAPGDPAPDVRFELADGSSLSIAELAGSVVIVDFWATWCIPCRPAMRQLEQLYRTHRDAGLRVYGLRLFDAGDPTAFLESLGISYPTGDGGPFVGPYAVGEYGLPTLYVIDRQGRIASLVVGFSDDTEAALEQAVERALEIPSSRPGSS